MFGPLPNPFRLHPGSTDEDAATEQNQTAHRLVVLSIIAAYVVLTGTLLSPDPGICPSSLAILQFYGWYTPVALALFWAVRHWPGHYPARRLFAMVLDYGSLGVSIIIDRETMMPMFMVIMWITVGYGMRYGRTYLALATAIALSAIGVIFWQISWTSQTPYLIITLVLSTIGIPHYAQWLKSGAEAARREAANRAKSRMLAQASHDLRQPLHAMSLLLTSLEQTGLKPAQREITARIDNSLQGVARLFRSLLDLSTLDSGSVQPNPEAVNLGDLLAEVADQNQQQAQRAGITLRVVHKIVVTDRALLTTMVQNLTSNAIKFSNGGKVLIGVRRRSDGLAVAVYDQGLGITPDHQDRVFEEFYQIRERGGRDQQGAGLGLSIVARMADLLGLKVGLSSVAGRGSCFWIGGIALAPANARPTPVTSIANVVWSPLAGMRVLLVEDDEDVLVATAQLLRSWQCEVDIALDLVAYQQSCDVIVADYDLGGGITGADVIASVRAKAGYAIPAILITGHDGNRIAEDLDDPAIPILRKPLSPAELRSAIATAAYG
jgi:signal transduction histidine kinase